MRSKLESYLGFARKSGKLIFGTVNCENTMEKGRVKLLIVAEDTAENSKNKMAAKAKELNVPYRIYGNSEFLSHIAGTAGRCIFAVTDENFAKIISEHIDSEEKEVLE